MYAGSLEEGIAVWANALLVERLEVVPVQAERMNSIEMITVDKFQPTPPIRTEYNT